MIRHISTLALALGLATGVASSPGLARADAVGDFYKGKKVRVIIGYSAGGGYDVYARMVTRHMSKYIPGNPTMVPQNKPGAGSFVAAGYMYSVAPKDGTVLGTIGQNAAISKVLEPERVKFDPSKFIWIGNVNEGNNVIMIWHTAGVKSWKDLTKKEIIVGGTGVRGTSVQYPRAMNNILGTKFKIIHGFRGGKRVDLAMERGEVQGRGSNAWASIKARSPQYLKEKLVTIPVQMGLTKEKDLDAPLLMDIAPNEATRKVFWLLSSGVRVGRPIMTTPGVPSDRVITLRSAFDAAVKDKGFLAEAKRANWDINPVSGIEVQKIIEETLKTPKQIIDLTNAALSKGKVFKCAGIVKDSKLCAKKKKKKKKKS
jgi:tripartite-type tricarboxylate transporter receptor subunit TctC